METYKEEQKWQDYLDLNIDRKIEHNKAITLSKMKYRWVVIYGFMSIVLFYLALFFSKEIWFGFVIIPINTLVTTIFMSFYVYRWSKIEKET